MRDTCSVGNTTEGIVLGALLQAGYRLLLPFGAGHPYDIALDVGGGKIMRVQCKTGRVENGAVFFPTASWCRDNNYRSYREDVDYFGIYCPGTREVYLVPIADVPTRAAYLRLDPPRNGQVHGIRWAKDYVIWP